MTSYSWINLLVRIILALVGGENEETSKIHPGNPLFLTPYVESENISEARKLAEVPFTADKFNIKSYAGLFTVNETYNSNHFLWYFPAIKPKTKDPPVLVWLQGGPGSSSLYGLFMENGPIEIQNSEFAYREINWATDYHLIYIDNPVGTGYSFTNDPRGYCKDETQVSEQLYSTLIQFFRLFPELQKNQFFITGESYAGKYVPSLAHKVHEKNLEAELKINLCGIAIGNGLSDPVNQINYHEYLLQLGLIDVSQASILQDAENKAIKLIENGKWVKATQSIQGLRSLFKYIAKLSSVYNFLDTNHPNLGNNISFMVQENLVRKNLHVGNLTFHNITNSFVFDTLVEDISKSVAPLMTELLDHYCVLIYNGQLDVTVPYPLTVNYLRKLNFTSADDYKNANRAVWMVDDEVAGYIHKAGNLMEVLVRNAGHMVPMDQPKWALNLMNIFTEGCSAKKDIN